MEIRNRSVLAGAALAAIGAVAGAWVTAKSGMFPFQQVPAAAQTTQMPELTFKTGFGPVVKAVQPAVVSITSTTRPERAQVRGQQPQIPEEFRDFFGGQVPFDLPQQGPRQGLGSGVIISADGYILTNNHVVDGADQVKVYMQDNRDYTAKVIGKDAQSDIAVVKIEASNLPHVSFGDSDAVQVGDVVLAMGNPFGIGQTVTMGIVGATHRNTNQGIEDYEDFIQTDAAINPGNSGGALVNLKGELIGINTAIVSRGGGNQGVGFAIPAKTAHSVMDQIIKNGKVSRGFMGVTIQSLNSSVSKQFKYSGTGGALVSDVGPDSPAEKAGLKPGDIITEINGTKVPDSADLRVRVASLQPGATAKLKVFREGAEREMSVVLGSQPGQEAASRDKGSNTGDGPRLGVSVEPASRNRGRSGGLVITQVAQGSAAEEAGLRTGDIILEVNRKPVNDPAELQRLVRENGTEPLLLYVESGSDRGRDKGASPRHFVTVQPR